MKIVIRHSLFLILFFGAMISFVIFLLCFPVDADAVKMTNTQYIIQSEINSFGGKSTGSSSKITFSGGQNSPGLYSGTNYKVRAGFQYIQSIVPFTFSISTTEINFGTIVPGEAVARDNTLTVSSGSTSGYQVTVQEDHPLRVSGTSAEISDTTCDSGNCSYTTAALWNSPLTYGFGYRCDNDSGTDCNSSFSTSNYYKSFPNAEADEEAQIAMSDSKVGTSQIVKITYKVNIPAAQPGGVYQNVIEYIAMPSL